MVPIIIFLGKQNIFLYLYRYFTSYQMTSVLVLTRFFNLFKSRYTFDLLNRIITFLCLGRIDFRYMYVRIDACQVGHPSAAYLHNVFMGIR